MPTYFCPSITARNHWLNKMFVAGVSIDNLARWFNLTTLEVEAVIRQPLRVFHRLPRPVFRFPTP